MMQGKHHPGDFVHQQLQTPGAVPNGSHGSHGTHLIIPRVVSRSEWLWLIEILPQEGRVHGPQRGGFCWSIFGSGWIWVTLHDKPTKCHVGRPKRSPKKVAKEMRLRYFGVKRPNYFFWANLLLVSGRFASNCKIIFLRRRFMWGGKWFFSTRCYLPVTGFYMGRIWRDICLVYYI